VSCGSLQPLDKRSHPLLRPTASRVFVRQPVPEPGVQCRRDDEDIGVRQPRGNNYVYGDDEHVASRLVPEARDLIPGGESCRKIDAPEPPTAAEFADDPIGDRLMGL